MYCHTHTLVWRSRSLLLMGVIYIHTHTCLAPLIITFDGCYIYIYDNALTPFRIIKWYICICIYIYHKRLIDVNYVAILVNNVASANED